MAGRKGQAGGLLQVQARHMRLAGDEERRRQRHPLTWVERHVSSGLPTVQQWGQAAASHLCLHSCSARRNECLAPPATGPLLKKGEYVSVSPPGLKVFPATVGRGQAVGAVPTTRF